MKTFFLSLLAGILLNCNITFATENLPLNFHNPDWWKTATLEDVVKEINQGADIHAKDKDNTTPLMFACTDSTRVENIIFLMNYGAKVSEINSFGQTPLMYASMNNDNHKIITTLIKHGAKVNQTNNIKPYFR